MEENFYMKKIKAMSLLLSLSFVCVGNQMYASAVGRYRRPVVKGSAQNFNFPTDDPDVESATVLFRDILISRVISKNTEELTKKFIDFVNFVNGMRENSKKYVSTVILSSPVTSVISNASISTDLKVMMTGSFLSRIYSNIDSVEWDIDVNDYKGTLNLHMKNIPADVKIMIASLRTNVVQIQGNKISYSF